MAVETKKAPPPDKPATDKVSSEQLSAAWDEAQGNGSQPDNKEPVSDHPEAKQDGKQTPEGETKTAPDNAESSRLGRKVAKMEQSFEKWADTINRLDDFLTRQDETRHQPQREELPQIISTPDDVERVLTAREQKFMQAKQSYESQYLKTVEKIREKDDTLHEEIYNEMIQNHNIMHAPPGHVGNGDMDARLNYANAKISILQRKMQQATTRQPNVKGEKPSGVTTGTRVKEDEPEVPALDEHASEFVRRMGLKPDDVKKYMKTELPWHLQGKR